MKLPIAATRILGSARLSLNKNAPTILTTTGIVSMVASTVLAVRATNQAVEVTPIIQKDIEEIKSRPTAEDYTEHDKMKDLVHIYMKSSAALLQVYAPAILAGAGGIACILAGHNMMVKRQASLLAAYSALDAGIKAYRSRVAEAVGPEKEMELFHGARTITVYDEAGQACEILDPNDKRPSPYSKFFDESNNNWTNTAEYNLTFLRHQQDWANQRLRAYGFVFLNEVYESLGLPRTQAGQIVGWSEKGNGDGFIDFGIYSIGDPSARAFVNGEEPSILLDFNVDGPINI